MAAILVLSPALNQVFIGQAYKLRGAVRDDQVNRPYDLSGMSGLVGKLVSLTGGTARTLATPPAGEGGAFANGVLTIVIANADSGALTPGRWYLELQIPTVGAEGPGMLVPALVPFDAVAL